MSVEERYRSANVHSGQIWEVAKHTDTLPLRRNLLQLLQSEEVGLLRTNDTYASAVRSCTRAAEQGAICERGVMMKMRYARIR